MGKEEERERNISVWLPLARPPLGTGPTIQVYAIDWELNQWPFGLQASVQSTEPHQTGLCLLILERREGREGGRETSIQERNKYWSATLSTRPNQRLNLQPRHVPWPRIEPVTLRSMGWSSTQLSHTGQGKIEPFWIQKYPISLRELHFILPQS